MCVCTGWVCSVRHWLKPLLVVIGLLHAWIMYGAGVEGVDSLKASIHYGEPDSDAVNLQLQMAQAYIGVQADSLLLYADAAYQMSKEIVWESGVGQSAERLAVGHIMKGEYSEARLRCKEAMAHYQKEGMNRAYALAHSTLGIIEFSEFNYAAAKKAYGRGRHLLLENGNKQGLVKVYANLANVYQKTGLYDSSLYFHHKALQLNKHFGNEQNAAINESNMGVVLQAMGNNEEALRYFAKAYRTFRRLGAGRLSGILQINVAKVQLALEQYSFAQKHYLELLDQYQKQGESSTLAAIKLDLGTVYLGMGQEEQALQHLTDASDLFLKFADTSSYVLCLTKMAGGYGQLGNLIEEQRMYTLLFSLRKYHDEVSRANIATSLAQYYLETKDRKLSLEAGHELYSEKEHLQAANRCLHSAARAYKSTERSQELSKAYGALKEVQVAMGQFDSALHFFQKQQVVEDSLQLRNSVRSLTQMELRFDFDREQWRDSIENLRIQEAQNRQITEEQGRFRQQRLLTITGVLSTLLVLLIVVVLFRLRKKGQEQNRVIAQRNNLIEWLLKEIHHRVKNNLQIVSSLMSIQSRSLADGAARDILKESQNRIKSISLVHESLYQVEDLSKIEAIPFLEKIALHVKQSLSSGTQEVEVAINGATLEMEAEQAIPLGIILNELVSNSFKHAFAGEEEPKIEVKLEELGDKVTLLYSDSGADFDQNAQVFSKYSIGMALIESLATDQLSGSFEMLYGGAEKFKITFPKEQVNGN